MQPTAYSPRFALLCSGVWQRLAHSIGPQWFSGSRASHNDYAMADAIFRRILGWIKKLSTCTTNTPIRLYEGANHAFNNDTSAARYNKPAAEQAWSRTIVFFKEHLKA